MKRSKQYKILGVIPARGGSKSIPKKNIKSLAGKPLIYYTIWEALRSKYLTKLIVSTDDPEIARISKKYEAEVPFLRPKKLARDSTPSLPVLQHALKKIEKLEKKIYDFVVLLEATSPFKKAKDIDGAILKLIRTKADSVVSVSKVREYHPIKMKKIKNDRLLPYLIKEKKVFRRQDLPPIYKRMGGIYAMKRDVLIKKNSLFGEICRPYIIPKERSFDIHDKIDFVFAQALAKNVR